MLQQEQYAMCALCHLSRYAAVPLGTKRVQHAENDPDHLL